MLNIITNMFEAISHLQLESSNWFDLEIMNNITYLFYANMEILIGYNIYSYIRGISNKSQRYFIIFGFVIFLWEIIANFIVVPLSLNVYFPNQKEGLFLLFSFMFIVTIIFSLIIRNKFISE